MYPWDMILASKRQTVDQQVTIIEDVTIRGNVSVDETGKTYNEDNSFNNYYYK